MDGVGGAWHTIGMTTPFEQQETDRARADAQRMAAILKESNSVYALEWIEAFAAALTEPGVLLYARSLAGNLLVKLAVED